MSLAWSKPEPSDPGRERRRPVRAFRPGPRPLLALRPRHPPSQIQNRQSRGQTLSTAAGPEPFRGARYEWVSLTNWPQESIFGWHFPYVEVEFEHESLLYNGALMIEPEGERESQLLTELAGNIKFGRPSGCKIASPLAKLQAAKSSLDRLVANHETVPRSTSDSHHKKHVVAINKLL